MALVPVDQLYIDANFKETQIAASGSGREGRRSMSMPIDDHVIDGTVESISPASGSVFSLLPPENATGNFTKIIQRVPVRIALPAGRARQRPPARRPQSSSSISTRRTGNAAATQVSPRRVIVVSAPPERR